MTDQTTGPATTPAPAAPPPPPMEAFPPPAPMASFPAPMVPQTFGPRPAAGVGGAAPSSAGKRFGGYLLEALLVVVTLGIGWLIWSLIVWGKGQTPAKSLLGMRCVRTDTGMAATWGTMALREIVGKGILGSVTFGITTLISCFMVLGDDRQAVWDKMANTIVVDDPDGRLLAPTA